MWTGLHGGGVGCVYLLPDASTRFWCARTQGSLSLVFEISCRDDTTAQSRSEADVNTVQIVLSCQAERAARGKCWIDGECAERGGGGWMSQDDDQDAYRQLGVSMRS